MLLLTRTSAYAYLNKIIVAEVTRTVRNIPRKWALDERKGWQDSVVNFDNVHVVAKALVGERIGKLTSGRQREVKRALGYALDWEELKML